MKERILDVLDSIDSDIISYEGDNLYDAGIIDSMMVLDIVAALEEEFDIEIDAELVTTENFANKNAIVAFMMELL